MGNTSINILNRRVAYFAAAIAMVFATFIPVLVSAATISTSSIGVSSSIAGATGVSYDVTFTPDANAGAYVIDFCTTPTIGTACTAPAGLDATSASNYTTGSADDANTVVRTGSLVDGTPFNVELTGITNPTTVGQYYARIVTYTADTDAGAYTSTALGSNVQDSGIVALSTTEGINVSGAVLESLVFCVSGAAITDNCAGAQTTPNISFGTDGVLSTALSEKTIYTELTTNAAKGAVVRLKSSTVGCGGLQRAGVSAEDGCGITPKSTAGGIATGDSQFGLKLGTAVVDEGDITPEGSYTTGDYYLGFSEANETTQGVTSTYGDPIFNTTNAPVNQAAVPLTFGANIGNLTPAGNYSATLSLIATGKF